jgi:thermitase
MFRLTPLAALGLTIWMSGSTLAQPAPSALKHTEGELLVRFAPGLDAAGRGAAAARLGGVVVKHNPVLGYAKIRVAPAARARALARLAASRDVVWAEPNGTWRAAGCGSCPQDPMLRPGHDPMPDGSNQWGVFDSGIPWLWRDGGGGSASTLIAIVDTGIDDFGSPHPDLAANVLATGRDFVDDDLDPTDAGAADLYGHGTHVAGIAAAATGATGIAGVAYGAKLAIVRVLDCTAGAGCPGTFEAIADGIQWAADAGARVINLSLGGASTSATVRTAIQYAIGKNAIVVASAGNDGAPVLAYPARYPEVIAVGATDASRAVAAFSNWGPELDVVAPGVDVWSAVPGDGWADFSGTSQAAPFVSGIAAVLADRNPAIEPLEVERWLRERATPLAGAHADRDGFGLVSFPMLEDWSDLPPPYGAAHHRNFLWEWLGFDVTAEPSLSDPLDEDGVPNIGVPGRHDGRDDGVMPTSIPRLPFLPPHLAPGAALDVGMSVSRWDGPRYGATPDRMLHLDSWIDWDSDGAFEAHEREIADHAENPGTWGANGKVVTRPITPIDEHLLGNPLRIRTRVAYGASVGTPDAPAATGEVEDDHLVNFVEDFDTALHVLDPGVYTISSTWDVAPDPSPPCSHRGAHRMAVSTHPSAHSGGVPCNGSIEAVNVMGTPTMNWKEYTTARLDFWYCHQWTACSPEPDRCVVRIDTSGVKHVVGPIPTGSGVMSIDLSAYVGSEAVIVEFVEHTDWNGRVAIDDVVVIAFDDRRPLPIADLGASRAAGTREVALTWTAPHENETPPHGATHGEASTYEVRYHTAPITTEAAWAAARRFDPRDVVGGAPAPRWPGSAESATFRAPSAFQTYHVAVRAGDETINLAPISNAASVTATPTLAVEVLALNEASAAPGDTARLEFRVTNHGNTSDTYGVRASDTRGWTLAGLPDAMAVAAGASSVHELPVIVASGASGGERDTVTLEVASLTDPTVAGADAGVVVATGTTDAPRLDAIAAGLQPLGPNPFRRELAVRFGLATREHASVAIYDVGGRTLRTLADRDLPAGEHALVWDGRDDRGRAVPAGLYWVRLRTPSLAQSRVAVRLE